MYASNRLTGGAQTMYMSASGRVQSGKHFPAAATTGDSISIDVSGSDCGSRTSASLLCATADFWLSVRALCHLPLPMNVSLGWLCCLTVVRKRSWRIFRRSFLPAICTWSLDSCPCGQCCMGGAQCNGISGWRQEDVAVQHDLTEIGPMDDQIICKEQLNDKQFLIYLITILTFSWLLFKWHSASSRKFIKSVLQARIVIFPPLDCSPQSVQCTFRTETSSQFDFLWFFCYRDAFSLRPSGKLPSRTTSGPWKVSPSAGTRRFGAWILNWFSRGQNY